MMAWRGSFAFSCLLLLHVSSGSRFLDMPRELVMDVNKECNHACNFFFVQTVDLSARGGHFQLSMSLSTRVMLHLGVPPPCELHAKRNAFEPVRPRSTWLSSGSCRKISLVRQRLCWIDCHGLAQRWVTGATCCRVWCSVFLKLCINRGPLPWQVLAFDVAKL